MARVYYSSVSYPPLTRRITPRAPVGSDLMDRRSPRARETPCNTGDTDPRRGKIGIASKNQRVDSHGREKFMNFSSRVVTSSPVRDRARHIRRHFQFSGNYSSSPSPEFIATSAITQINVIYTLPFECSRRFHEL